MSLSFEIGEFDCRPCAGNFVDAHRIVSAELEDKPEDMSPEGFAKLINGNIALGAFDDEDELVGVSFIDLNTRRREAYPGSAWGNMLAVRHDLQRGHGIGSTLLRRAEILVASEGIHHFSFKASDDLQDYYQDRGYDQYADNLYVKHLN